MSDLISREAVLEFEEYVGEPATWDKPYPKGDLYVKSEIIERIPSAEPEIIRCKDCIHRPIDTGRDNDPEDLEFPDDRCPCRCMDDFYSWMPEDDWFCANGE